MKSKLAAIFLVLALLVSNSYAQYPEDALRIGQSSYGIDARSMAMGNAMTGLAQGFDATYFNPAGLAQSRMSQITMGLNFLGYGDNSTYLGNSNSLSSSQTDISDLGLVYPFPTTRGSFVIALGYSHGPDYNSALSVGGLNPSSSIIPSLYYGPDTSADIAYMDFLEHFNRNPYVSGNVRQSGKTYTSGGINNWFVSAATDVAVNFSVGLTLNLISGSYKYTQNFQEAGVPGDNYQNSFFTGFALTNNDRQDISGWNAKLGMLYKLQDPSGNTVARFGIAVQFPTFVTVTDNYSSSGTSGFASGPLGPAGTFTWATTNGYGQSETPGSALQYDITTPFKFALGVSGGTTQFLAAADIEYADWTQLSFSNSNLPGNAIDNLNSQIKQDFRPTLGVRVGLEVAMVDPSSSLFVPYLRLGGEFLPSPYVGDGGNQAQKFVSGGLGASIQNSIDLSVAYQYGWWNTTTLVYPSTVINGVTYAGASTSGENVTNGNFMFTFKYNF